jgi:hypothetical protein
MLKAVRSSVAEGQVEGLGKQLKCYHGRRFCFELSLSVEEDNGG